MTTNKIAKMPIDQQLLHVAFVMDCMECGDGNDIGPYAAETYSEAVKIGWTMIEYEDELPSANFVGVCPRCSKEGT